MSIRLGVLILTLLPGVAAVLGLLLAEVLRGVLRLDVVGVLWYGSKCFGSLVDVVVMDDCEWCRCGVDRRVFGFLAGVLRDVRLGGALDGSV